MCMTSSHDVSQGQASSSPSSATLLSRRREILATIAMSVSVGAFGLGSLPCEASVLDGLKEYKRDSNAKFLVGPIRLVRQRMFNVLTLTEGSSPQYGEAQEALRKASLDCLEPAVGLQGFAKVRDVCTLSIVYKSVTKGPAAKHDPDSAEYKEATASLIALGSGLHNLDDLLVAGAAGSAEAGNQFKATFISTMASLDRYELAVQKCIGYEPSLDRKI